MGSAITPQLRLGWDITLVQQHTDALTAVIEVGGGYGVAFPTINDRGTAVPMNFLFQYTAIAGFGYRGDRGNLHWGLHVGVGPLFYGAHYVGAGPEKRWVATVEGRAELGWRIQQKVAVGISAGLSSPLGLPDRSLAAPFVGNALVGVFANWR